MRDITKSYVPGLARDGFTAIRAALKRDKPEIALDIAEALHNMPDEGNDFQKELTMVESIKHHSNPNCGLTV